MHGHVTVDVENFTIHNQSTETPNQSLFHGELFHNVTEKNLMKIIKDKLYQYKT